MSLKVHVYKARKVLVASVGVATVSFVGLRCLNSSVANLPAPPSCDVAPNNPYCVGGPIDGGPDTRDAAGDDADATTG